ncbi:unnamed protein product [Orchesella dallaii]|uniref:Uncharacterized protein n=1 Tax=Orchesella dallaii TaxID=48710 RepID=A0ABP1QXU4_9HEXA
MDNQTARKEIIISQIEMERKKLNDRFAYIDRESRRLSNKATQVKTSLKLFEKLEHLWKSIENPECFTHDSAARTNFTSIQATITGIKQYQSYFDYKIEGVQQGWVIIQNLLFD